MSYVQVAKRAPYDSVEMIIRKRRLLFAGAVKRATYERLTRLVILETVEHGTRRTRNELGPISSQ